MTAETKSPKAKPTVSKSDGAPLFSLIIPVYNEEELLFGAASELCQHYDEQDAEYELIIAENGSKDRTREIGKELMAAHSTVRVMENDEPNYGLALRRGIEAARGTFIVCDEIDICDIDFHRRALAVLQSDQCDMVIGSKLHEDALDNRPFMRHVATIGINLLLKILLDFKGTDTHGLKAFHRETLLNVVGDCIVDKDLFASELVIRAERSNYRILEIPIEIEEKRAPSINLFSRVPNVLKNLGRLVLAIRFNRDL